VRTVVLDASVALKVVISEALSEQAVVLLERSVLVAPDLLVVECASAIWKRRQRGDIDADLAGRAFRNFRKMPIIFRSDRGLIDAAFEMAGELGHPVYDCLYLALAEEWRTVVVTADRRLVAAARRQERYSRLIETLEA